ncbi:MAG TPA: hypothetical protein VLV49_18215 [Terriglobales bacterium]|nr:hypothetical protein [Terriglobales bacterium]
MIDSLFFAGFDPLHEVPELCTVCSLRPPVFGFDYRALDENGESRKTTGFCCAACAAALLEKLERAESREWAEEEAALAKDDFDVTALHKQRLAAFPGSGRK